MDDSQDRWLLFEAAYVTHSFEYLKEYYHQLSSVIIGEKERLLHIFEELENEPQEIREEYNDYYADDLFKMENIVEKNFCNSIFISIYSLIEEYLNKICKYIKITKNIQIGYTDLNGNGVERAKKYIKKLGDLSINDFDEAFLRGINAMRNAIAHANGKLLDMENKTITHIIEFSKSVPGCTIDYFISEDGKEKPREVQIKLECIEYCLTQSEQIFTSIFKQLHL